MARDAIEAFGIMDIRLRTPLTTSLLPIRDGVTEPAIFVRRSSHHLEIKIPEIGHLFLRIVYIHLIDFRISGLIPRKYHCAPTCSDNRAVFEVPSSQRG